MRTTLSATLLIALLAGAVGKCEAQEELLPPANRMPMLVLDHAGPHAQVTALAFSADSNTLYAGGYDKLVRTYNLRGGKHVAGEPLRVPLGPGNAGALNAIAISPDGKWIAVAGRSPIRGEVWSGGSDGIVTSTRYLSPLMKRDLGVVYLFAPGNPQGGRVIRGPQSEVRALAFANPVSPAGPVLITAGIEWNAEGKEFGVVRLFDAATGKEIDSRGDFPSTTIPPGLAAWPVGPDGKSLRVAVTWPSPDPRVQPGELLVWDAPAGKLQRIPDVPLNAPLAVRVVNKQAAEVITGGFDVINGKGRLGFRATDPVGDPRTLPLSAPQGQAALALAVAPITLPDKQDLTAVLLELAPRPVGTTDRRTELRLLSRNGETVGSVTLKDISNEIPPVMAVSPDGQFVAIGGFTDHRVEVYEAASIAAGKIVKQLLPGDPSRHNKVEFLEGQKLWLGATNDTPRSGGVVLNFVTREARANDGKVPSDSPKAEIPPVLESPDFAKGTPGKVTFFLGAAGRQVALSDGERPTTAAVLPGKPVWEPTLGPLVAVAHTNDRYARTLITLHDANGKSVLQLGGPSQPVRSLAFSATRPLLAAVGEDRTVYVWSLRELNRSFPVIEGLTVTMREAEVIVASIEPGSAARGKLEPGDVIEKVGKNIATLEAAKSASDFVLAVRTMPVTSNAIIQVKGKAQPVVVPVGTALGHRRPLFHVWVDPIAIDGRHDWISWTAAGPYDTSSANAEARIVWVTATGDPARPVTFAPVNQYRPLYYKKDFFRFLAAAGEFDEASDQYAVEYPPRIPVLVANLTGLVMAIEKRGASRLIRDKATGIDVSVLDGSGVLPLDQAELRWRTIARDGTAGAWQSIPFRTGRVTIPLDGYQWTRGTHRFQFAVHTPVLANPVIEFAQTWEYFPPAATLTAVVDGKAAQLDEEITTKAEAIAVAAIIKNGDGDVTVRSSVVGSKPFQLEAQPGGMFAPVKVPLDPFPAKTVIRVNAVPQGKDVDVALERVTVDVIVRRMPPDPVPVPQIKLVLQSPHDPPAEPSAPRVSATQRVLLNASVVLALANPIHNFEWELGDGRWIAGQLDKENRQEQTVELPKNGEPLKIRVRAQSKNSPFAEDSVMVVFSALPEPGLDLPPAEVLDREQLLTGPVATVGDLPFTLHVETIATHTGERREFAANIDPATMRWRATIQLAPGESTIGLIARNKWGVVRKPGIVRMVYARPPILLPMSPVDVGTASVGDLVATVLTPRGVPPTEVRINGMPVTFRREGDAIGLFGIVVERLKVVGIPVKTGTVRLPRLSVVIKNAEGESRVAEVPIKGAAPKPVSPPVIGLTHGTNITIAHGDSLASDEKNFLLALAVVSDQPLTRVEIQHTAGALAGTEFVAGIDPQKAVVAGGFHKLTAKPEIRLREGVNRIRVVAANRDEATVVEFTVSYTPPAVRVLIDAIIPAGGERFEVVAGQIVTTDSPILEIRGRVVWDMPDHPVASDTNLKVILFANQVAHLPVRVDMPRGTQQERPFVVPAFVNAANSRLRFELRSGNRASPLPRQGYAQAEIAVKCQQPLQKQRFHVVVIAPEITRQGKDAVVRSVLEGVGGSAPKGAINFDRGAFEQSSFTRSVLYRPLVNDVEHTDVLGLLKEIEREILLTTQRKGEEWVNDVVLIYYQGRDLVGKDDALLLHTSSSVSRGGVAKEYMIRLDDLPPLPGVRFALVNVVDPDGQELKPTLANGVPFLRYPWKAAADTARLPRLFKSAVLQKRELGEITALVQSELKKLESLITATTDRLPLEERSRIVGLARPLIKWHNPHNR